MEMGIWVTMPTNSNFDKLEHNFPRHKGSLRDRYENYIYCCNDGNGYDKITGEKLKTFDEWLDG